MDRICEYGQSVLCVVGVPTIKKGYARRFSLAYEVYIPKNKANLRYLIAATGLVILLKLD